MSTDLVHIPFNGNTIYAFDNNGRPEIALKPLVATFGFDYSTQLRKLKSRSWAVIGTRATTAADGKTYEMRTIDLRTLSMWLATINENRVPEPLRPALIEYQSRCADVIEAFWTKRTEPQPQISQDNFQIVLDRLIKTEVQLALATAPEGRVLAWEHLIQERNIRFARDGRAKPWRAWYPKHLGGGYIGGYATVHEAINCYDIAVNMVLPPQTKPSGQISATKKAKGKGK